MVGGGLRDILRGDPSHLPLDMSTLLARTRFLNRETATVDVLTSLYPTHWLARPRLLLAWKYQRIRVFELIDPHTAHLNCIRHQHGTSLMVCLNYWPARNDLGRGRWLLTSKLPKL